jgi:hypothetical protein
MIEAQEVKPQVDGEVPEQTLAIQTSSVKNSAPTKADADKKKIPKANAKFAVSLSVPLVVPAPPVPAPLSLGRARTPRSRRATKANMASTQRQAPRMNVHPMKRLAQHRRWCSSILTYPLPLRGLSRDLSLKSMEEVAKAKSFAALLDAAAWSSADPMVALLVPSRALLKVELAGTSHNDELEKEMRNFVLSLTDEIRERVLSLNPFIYTHT